MAKKRKIADIIAERDRIAKYEMLVELKSRLGDMIAYGDKISIGKFGGSERVIIDSDYILPIINKLQEDINNIDNEE